MQADTVSASSSRPASTAIDCLRQHWPEYLIEACGLSLLMIAACAFASLLEHPASPLRASLHEPIIRRSLMGAAMGLTAISIIYSPWGKRSGAHLNPAVSFTFMRLGKIAYGDAGFYMAAQFTGAMAGIAAASVALGTAVLGDPAVYFVMTRPGMYGLGIALLAEFTISCVLMLVVLSVSNIPEINRFTGLLAGMLLGLYITVEAPLSGMSMNPARSLASALAAQDLSALWIYFIAPPLGMSFASWLYVRLRGIQTVLCCKLHHENSQPCIFRCGYTSEDKAMPVRTQEKSI